MGIDSMKIKENKEIDLKESKFEWPDWLDLPNFWYDFKNGVKNLFNFFWVVWKWRAWDNSFNLELFSKGIERYLKESQNSYLMEIDETRLPKEANMRRVIEIIKNINDELIYTDMAEKELGELPHWDIKFEPCDDLKDDEDKPYYELVDERSDEEKEFTRKVYRRSEEIEQAEWDELWEILRKDSKGWWN